MDGFSAPYLKIVPHFFPWQNNIVSNVHFTSYSGISTSSTAILISHVQNQMQFRSFIVKHLQDVLMPKVKLKKKTIKYAMNKWLHYMK